MNLQKALEVFDANFSRSQIDFLGKKKKNKKMLFPTNRRKEHKESARFCTINLTNAKMRSPATN